MQKSYIPHSKEGCRILMNAIRAVNIEQARKEMRQARRVAAWLSGFSVLLLVFWSVFMFVRVNALKRVRWRLLVDIVCMSLSSLAMVASGLAAIKTSSARLLPFTEAVFKRLPGPWKAYYHTLATLGDLPDPCRNQFRADSRIFTDDDLFFILDRIKILIKAHTSTRLYWFAVVMCSVSVFLFIASIIAALHSLFHRESPSEANRLWSKPKPNNRTFRGVFQPNEAVEFFMRFIESVPSPADGVELPTQRTVMPTQGTVIAGWREENGCQICHEVMLEDIAQLHGCRHAFHRRCILKWLLFADVPTCPLCAEPLRLCNQSTGNNEEDVEDVEQGSLDILDSETKNSEVLHPCNQQPLVDSSLIEIVSQE